LGQGLGITKREGGAILESNNEQVICRKLTTARGWASRAFIESLLAEQSFVDDGDEALGVVVDETGATARLRRRGGAAPDYVTDRRGR
jgi:hypothetical protein